MDRKESRSRSRGRSQWPRVVGAIAVAAGMVVLPLSVSASAQPTVTPPTVTLGPVGTAEDTGVVVTATVDPEGTDTFYEAVYGQVGGALSQSTGWQDAGAGTTAENLSITVDQLAPSTTYNYQVALFSNALGQQFNSTTGTITTAAAPTGPPAPVIPPKNPPDGIFGFCASDAACVNDMNGDRAALENLAPLALSSNWSTLTGAEQIFVWTNLERTSRGEAAISNLVNTYDADVQTGVTNDKDPALADLPGRSGSIWAGAFPTTLGAMYGWLYDDGPGGANLECTATNTAGCWGHRDNVLADPANFGGANPNEMDAVAGVDSAGQKSYAAAFVANPNPTPAANLVLSWAAEQPFLAGAGTPPTPTPTSDHISTRVCQDCTPPLVYQDGPIGATSRAAGEETVTPIFWFPAGSAPPSATYEGRIEQYLTDVAAESGTASNVFSVDTEYFQTIHDGFKQNINYIIHAGGAQTDTDAFPTGGCTPDPGYTACITDAQLQTELNSYLPHNTLPADLGDIYPVFLPPGVETVDGTGTTAVTSAAGYCGYHNGYPAVGGGTLLYIDEPYPPLNGCGTGQAPNNDAEADSAINILSVELNEAITDPTGSGWVDSSGNEIGDECDSTFGASLGSTDPNNPGTTEFNQRINGHDYYTQEEFSNAEALAAGPGQGCVQNEAQVTAAGATSAVTGGKGRRVKAAPKTDTVTVQASNWAIAPGGRVPLTVKVTTPTGTPVVGDPITLDVLATVATRAVCGTPAKRHGVTGANGEWSTVYTASKVNLACAVLAIEGRTGQSGQATLGQGRAAWYDPDLTVKAPARAALGRAATMSVTLTNPGDAVGSTLVGVSLTSAARKGIAAGQVHLSYSRDGRWVAVPLTGSTSSAGAVISGSLTGLPVTLAGRARQTITLRLIVDGPVSAATLRSALSLRVSMNQFNPANRSACMICYQIVTLHLVRRS